MAFSSDICFKQLTLTDRRLHNCVSEVEAAEEKTIIFYFYTHSINFLDVLCAVCMQITLGICKRADSKISESHVTILSFVVAACFSVLKDFVYGLAFLYFT